MPINANILTNVAALSGAAIPPVVDPTLILHYDAPSASTTTNTTGTNRSLPAGSMVFACVHTGAAGAITGFNDSVGGNTWNSGTLQSTNGRVQIFRSILTNPLPAGTTFTWTSAGSAFAQCTVVYVPTGIAFDITTGGASGTSTTPTLTSSTLSSQPQYVFFGFFSNGATNFVTAPAGFTKLGTPSTISTVVFYQKVNATTAVTCAPTGHTNVAWALVFLSCTTS